MKRRPPLARRGATLLLLAATSVLTAASAATVTSVPTAASAATVTSVPTAASAAIPAGSPQEILGACAARLADDAGANAVKRCPALPGALRSLGLTQLLRRDWREALNRSSLQDLIALSRRYRGKALSVPPSQSMLPQIVQELRREQVPRSWWQSFKERLRRWLQMPRASGAPWLAQLLSAVPAAAVRVMLYVTTVAVLVMALWMVWRELLAAGVFERRGGAGQSPRPVGAGAVAPTAELAPADVDAAPPGQRAAVLLRLLLQAMRRAGRVHGERGLSCRELSERAAFDSDGQRRRFASVARWAERERYAGDAGAIEPASVLADGRQLYEELRGGAAASQARP